MNAHVLGTRLYILFVIAACFPAVVAGGAYAGIQEPPSLQRFTSGGHVLGFDETGYFASNGTYAIRVRFEGASGSSGSVVGTSPGTGTSGATASAVPEFEGISYEDVWPGIGVEYDAPKSGIARSTWTVAPGADPKAIQLRYNRPVALTGNGSLQIGFETGTMTESAPIAWQDVDGKRRPVEVSFATTDDDLVGFEVGAYRSDLPLVIDPTLEWNTFLGGTGEDYGSGIAVDASGNVYVGGSSRDDTWGSPVRAFTGARDAFAAKLDSAGNLVWNTFLGGTGNEYDNSIAVDASGNVYVNGPSGYGTAPTWGSPVRAYTAGISDAFVAKLDRRSLCNPELSIGCVDGWGKGMLLVKETVPGKEKLIAKFIKGPEIPAPAFGDPSGIGGTAYAACIYDDQGVLVAGLEIDRAGQPCGSKPCWRDMGPRGFLYKDSGASADGVSQVRLLAGSDGRTMIMLKAANNSKKSQLGLPTGIALGLSNSTSPTIQLVGSDAQACFSLTLGNVKKQKVDMFKAVK